LALKHFVLTQSIEAFLDVADLRRRALTEFIRSCSQHLHLYHHQRRRPDNVCSHPKPLLRTMIFNERGFQLVLRRVFSIQTALVVIWIIAILWGERWVFQRSLAECEWNSWEKWASILGMRRRRRY
jgi:hypothetical protein